MSATPGPIVVVAEWRLRPGVLGEALAIVAALESASRTEPGCRAFEAFAARDDPRRMTVVERYDDRDAFVAHRASDHFRELVVDRLAPLLTERVVRAHVVVDLGIDGIVGYA